MSDIKAALVGAFLGGLLSLGGIFVQSLTSESQAIKQAKRDKLDAFMENVIQAQSCIFSSDPLKKEECRSDKSTLRISTLSYIYFPELKNYAINYSYEIEALRTEIVKCEITHFKRQDNADLDCIKNATEKSDIDKKIEAINKKVEEIAGDLW